MKNLFLILILCCTAGLFAEKGAYEIARDNDELESPDSMSSMTTMVLVDKNDVKKMRVMKIVSVKYPDRDKTYIEFKYPADIKGTKFLSISDTQGDGDDQRLYLPALDRIRKISSSNSNGQFMGSDITYYDIRSKELGDFDYSLLGTEALGETSCWVLKSVPLKDDCPYGRIISYISQENCFNYRTELYSKGGELIKTIEVIEAEEIDGYFVATRSIVSNLETNHRTLLQVSDIELNLDVDDATFSVQNLR